MSLILDNIEKKSEEKLGHFPTLKDLENNPELKLNKHGIDFSFYKKKLEEGVLKKSYKVCNVELPFYVDNDCLKSIKDRMNYHGINSRSVRKYGTDKFGYGFFPNAHSDKEHLPLEMMSSKNEGKTVIEGVFYPCSYGGDGYDFVLNVLNTILKASPLTDKIKEYWNVDEKTSDSRIKEFGNYHIW